jgi:hypothetical protein
MERPSARRGAAAESKTFKHRKKNAANRTREPTPERLYRAWIGSPEWRDRSFRKRGDRGERARRSRARSNRA